MKYLPEEILEYVQEEDIKFIRLAFCDVFGRQRNIAVMPGELPRAFESGIAIDASAIPGFGGEVRSDLFLHPDPSTLARLPWRPESGGVVRMFCDVTYPDGTGFECDTRTLLRRAARAAEEAGLFFSFGPEMEFYLFRNDENGDPTRIPADRAGYMDIAPEDRGENVRRDICLTLEKMGIQPESSHHEEGPGQNEIDFRHSDPLSAADNTVTFRSVVQTIAVRNGLTADFSPKPLPDEPGSGMHVNFSVQGEGDPLPHVIAGILEHVRDMTVFLNPSAASYERLGVRKAPRYVTWSEENRSQLIRIPAAPDGNHRAELRSPDPTANPYLALALLIRVGLEGVEAAMPLPEPADLNTFTAAEKRLAGYRTLPSSLREAAVCAEGSAFIRRYLPEEILRAYYDRSKK